jgi:hypothetical protein
MAVMDSVAEGIIPRAKAEDLLIIVSVFVGVTQRTRRKYTTGTTKQPGLRSGGQSSRSPGPMKFLQRRTLHNTPSTKKHSDYFFTGCNMHRRPAQLLERIGYLAAGLTATE